MNPLTLIGICLATSLCSSLIIKKLNLPQVIGHILIGIIIGRSGMQLFDQGAITQFELLAQLTLAFIGTLIGGELRWSRLKKFGKAIFLITFFETVLSMSVVSTMIWLLTQNIPLSLIMGALASATAPGGTTTVIQEYRARGQLTSTLFGVIGADDAAAIIIFAFAFNISKSILNPDLSFTIWSVIQSGGYEILGSVIIGVLIGLVFISLVRFFRDDDAKQIMMFAAIFLCCGIAITFHFSLILSTMILGICIGNVHPHRSRRYFNQLSQWTPPLYIIFFILIGARLQLNLLMSIGLIGICYIVCRIIGKLSGAWIGGTIANAPVKVTQNLGLCLLSQAGVALGLAISAQQELSQLSPEGAKIGIIVINIITISTLFFQIIGPILTKLGLDRAGEINKPI